LPAASEGRTIWIADAHRGDGKRFVVHADEKLAAFLELELAIRAADTSLYILYAFNTVAHTLTLRLACEFKNLAAAVVGSGLPKNSPRPCLESAGFR